MKFMFVVLILSCSLSYAAAATLKRCSTDSECSTEQFCYQKSGLCSPCTQCHAYRRHDVAGLCVKEPSQCGGCLDGFVAEVLVNGQTRELCVPVSPSVVAPVTSQPFVSGKDPYIWTPFLFLMGALLIMASLLSYFLVKCNVRIKQRTHFFTPKGNNSASSAVLYAPSAPDAPSAPHGDFADVKYFESYISSKEEEQYLEASKYLDPNYVKSPPNSAVGEVAPPQDDVDGLVAPPTSEEPSYLLDEATQPSLWTPGPNYEETANSAAATTPLVTSFAGILSLNAQGASSNHNANTANSEPNGQFNVTTNNIVVINSSGNNATGIFNWSKS